MSIYHPLIRAAPTPLSLTETRIPHLLFALTFRRASRFPPAEHKSLRRRYHATAGLLKRLPKPPRPSQSTTISKELFTTTRPVSIYLWAVGLFGATVGLYLSYYYASYRASIARAAQLQLPQNADVSDRWNDVSRDYDEEIEFSEKAMFMARKRRRLLGGELVQGKVLEVSCGTGRNFQWYDFERVGESKITELVFNDQSAVMLEAARGKWEELQSERRRDTKRGKPFEGHVMGVVGDAGVGGVIARPEGGFDTIVQTMGVCSMQYPVSFLRQMNRLIRQPGEGTGDPDDKGGRILLLEHGRGHHNWINRLLDTSAVMHADRYGCWYNKDMQKIIEESGLKIGSVRRYHLGTTWEAVLRPNPELFERV